MVVRTTSAEETEAFGARLASARPGDDALYVVYLTGDLGAGKTTLTRGLLRALGVTGAVRSPTYTLVEVYELASGMTALHLDLYRLSDPAELHNLGLREWARGGHLWLIEWPERGGGLLPAADLGVTLTAGDGGHDIEVSARTDLGTAWINSLAGPAPAR
jgi:tRNA threonylcarbamoyladenosine biosynthesis protein TsaE